MCEGRIELALGDITKRDVEAIVTAANAQLRGGGGVDGAVHRAAGPGLLAECRSLGGCPTGEARITSGHQLGANYVIHAVGPIWHGGGNGESQQLESCYTAALRLAKENNARSIAFPCISTGIYGFPKQQACEIALSAVMRWLAAEPLPERVVFCCFGEDDFQLYQSKLMADRHV